MITYDQQNRFYNQLLEIVEKMGGRISAHGNLHGGVFISVIVFHEYWVSKGFIPHSQASLENISESKVLEIIGELQDDEYYSIDDEYHDLDDGGIING